MAQRYLAQINLGLEPLLKDELKTLGARRIEVIDGGVEFECTRPTLYQALLWSRIANRIYWRMAEFTIPNRASAYDKIVHFNWLAHIVPHAKIELNVQWDGSQNIVKGQGELETLVKTGIEKYFMDKKKTCQWFVQDQALDEIKSVNPHTEEHLDQKHVMILLVRLFQGKLFFSLDLCGELMHKRGWRIEDGPAPIRATLASAILKKMGYHQKSKDLLIDPMCGSGTFGIEAFAMKTGKMPRNWNFYTCQYLVGFDLPLWKNCHLKDPLCLEQSTQEISILMADQSEKAVGLSQEHLKNANMTSTSTQEVTLIQSSVQELSQQKIYQDLIKKNYDRIIVVANPPYGLRIEEKNSISDLISLIQSAKKQGKAKTKILGLIYPSNQDLPPNQNFIKSMKFKHGGLSVTLHQM